MSEKELELKLMNTEYKQEEDQKQTTPDPVTWN